MPFLGKGGNGGNRQGSATFAQGRTVAIDAGATFAPAFDQRIVGLSRVNLTVNPGANVRVIVAVRAGVELVPIADYVVGAGVTDTRTWNVAGRQATFSLTNQGALPAFFQYLFSSSGSS